MLIPPIKICPHCKKEKPCSEFFKNKSTKDGFSWSCKQCHKENWQNKSPNRKKVAARFRKRHPLNALKYKLKKHYDMTLEQYDQMFEKQNGTCLLCNKIEIGKRLAVDHDHETGKIRGLLCQRCNCVLGLADENIDLFYKLINHILGEESCR